MINPGQNDVTCILPELVHDAGGAAFSLRATPEARRPVDLVVARALQSEQLIALCTASGKDLSLSELQAIQVIATERADAKLINAVESAIAGRT